MSTITGGNSETISAASSNKPMPGDATQAAHLRISLCRVIGSGARCAARKGPPRKGRP